MTEQLRKIKEEIMKTFVNSLETFKYSEELNEFGTEDCVICMDPFVKGVKINRIPTCRHYFHDHCCMQWFESKAQEEE